MPSTTATTYMYTCTHTYTHTIHTYICSCKHTYIHAYIHVYNIHACIYQYNYSTTTKMTRVFFSPYSAHLASELETPF